MSRAPAPPLHEDIPMKARDMKAWLGLALGMGLLAVTAAASAGDFGDRVDRRMDRKGDRIDRRLDRRGALADARWDRRGDRFNRRWDRHH